MISKFTGQTSQAATSSILLIKQLAMGADLDVTWCAQLVASGDVIQRGGEILVIVGADSTSVRAFNATPLRLRENGAEQDYLRMVWALCRPRD